MKVFNHFPKRKTSSKSKHNSKSKGGKSFRELTTRVAYLLLIKLMKGEQQLQKGSIPLLLFSSCMVGSEKWIPECECVFNSIIWHSIIYLGGK